MHVTVRGICPCASSPGDGLSVAVMSNGTEDFTYHPRDFACLARLIWQGSRRYENAELANRVASDAKSEDCGRVPRAVVRGPNRAASRLIQTAGAIHWHDRARMGDLENRTPDCAVHRCGRARMAAPHQYQQHD
jgi:hypothetical protein